MAPFVWTRSHVLFDVALLLVNKDRTKHADYQHLSQRMAAAFHFIDACVDFGTVGDRRVQAVELELCISAVVFVWWLMRCTCLQ